MKRILTVATILLCSGCSNGFVGWGGTYEVLYQDTDLISIQYDEVVEDYETIEKVAVNHCASMNKKTKLSNVNTDPLTFGLIKTFTFTCISATP